jgi:hypothetical protein
VARLLPGEDVTEIAPGATVVNVPDVEAAVSQLGTLVIVYFVLALVTLSV